MTGNSERVWVAVGEGDQVDAPHTPMVDSEALRILAEYPGVAGIDIYANGRAVEGASSTDE